MHPDLVIGEHDLMPNDQQMLFSLCRQRGITHLIYMGVHTQVCLLGKSIGLRAMTEAGMDCVLARDLTDAHGKYDPAAGITPDQFTAEVVAHFEKHLAPSINMAEMLTMNGLWDSRWIVDPVRIAPWGTRMRPHLFEQEITVTLSAPWQPNAEIHYTLDGTEPTSQSPVYKLPLKLRAATFVRALALRMAWRVLSRRKALSCGSVPSRQCPTWLCHNSLLCAPSDQAIRLLTPTIGSPRAPIRRK